MLFGENWPFGRILDRAGVPYRGPERKGALDEVLTSASDAQRQELSSLSVAGLEMKRAIYPSCLAPCLFLIKCERSTRWAGMFVGNKQNGNDPEEFSGISILRKLVPDFGDFSPPTALTNSGS